MVNMGFFHDVLVYIRVYICFGAACPYHCNKCSLSGSAILCDANSCDDGYARSSDGSCLSTTVFSCRYYDCYVR